MPRKNKLFEDDDNDVNPKRIRLESEKQKAQKRAKAAQRLALKRANKSEEQKAQDRAKDREKKALKNANKTEEQKSQERARLAQIYAQKKANLTDEQRLKRNAAAKASRQRRIAALRKGTLNSFRIYKSDDIKVQLHDLGPMDIECASCKSLNFASESNTNKLFSHCCNKDKVEIKFPEYPDLIKNLSTGTTQEAKNFQKEIRAFNSALAFASFGAKVANASPGIYCFRVSGSVYHKTSKDAHPNEGSTPKYAQLYMLDSSDASEIRMQHKANQGCNPQTMEQLSEYMNNENILAQAYKNMRQVEDEMKSKGEVPDLTLSFKNVEKNDKRRYNKPTADEIAVVFVNTDGEPPFERDIRVYNKNSDETRQISILHPKLDAMVYPLLYPTGEDGWHPFLNQKDGKTRCSQLMYYSYLLANRGQFNPFIQSGKLTQQFIIDAYMKTEANRLNYLRYHQDDLRAEDYKGLTDNLINKEAGVPLGKQVILPATFNGSMRSQLQNYQDAMSVVRKFGKPDFFITMTCNPKWKEVTDALQNCKVENRPDQVAKVFHQKMLELVNDITVKNVLGKCISWVYVIEFQKRGLPHMHMLIMVDKADKPTTPEIIDQCVWAEIPDKDKDPELYEIVTRHMIHGPCGVLNPKSVCMEKGKCIKEFPKEFELKTRDNINGYAKYQRRSLSMITEGNKTFDNSFVVPYNASLLKKYNCHINVEVCSSIRNVKYLFKYVYKGYDCAEIEITGVDEIQDYLNGRYVTPPEAMWRLNSYKMYEMSHSIIRLAVHLEGRQKVYFKDGEEQKALDRAEIKETTLTAWFNLNATNASARKYLYNEIPLHYVFKPKENRWKSRKRGGEKIISRMYGVSSKDSERFYLRLLLLHVRGATCFNDLRAVDGVVYKTFEEAARKRHLLESDEEWDIALKEAVVYAMPKQLRLLFSWIYAFTTLSDPMALWEKYKEDLMEDFKQKNLSWPEQRALQDIMFNVSLHGTFIWRLPPIDYNKLTENVNRDEFNAQEEMEDADIRIPNLNPAQKAVFDRIINVIDNPSIKKRSFFLDGPGGSGKTYLYQTLLSYLRGRNQVVLPVASTGIAATFLKGGRTSHSQFKLPIPMTKESVSSITPTSIDAPKIRDCKLIIWDEAGMTQGLALTIVDRMLRDVTNSKELFGGIAMLYGGDFRQTLPIVPHGGNAEILESTIKRCPIWKHIQEVKLTQNMRAVNDKAYADWLIKLGDGKLTNEYDLGDDIIEIPPECICNDSLINEIFGETFSVEDSEKFAYRAILCPLNEDTFEFNGEILNRLEGQSTVYQSIDTIDTEDEQERINFPTEFLNSINLSGLPPHKLVLKVGATIMLIRNLNSALDLCNGTKLIVVKLDKNIIYAKVLTEGRSKGNVIFIPRMKIKPSETDLPFKLERKQFPIRVAFAMTINKAQGQTLEKVGLYLSQPVFAHGQLYVAFSRVTSQNNIKVQVKETVSQGKLVKDSDKVFTRNVVLTEIL